MADNQVAAPIPKQPTPVKFFVNDDMGYKVPVAGTNAPEGPYDDFRFGFTKTVAGFGEDGGSLSLGLGSWAHFPLNDMSKAKERWWGEITYKNPKWLDFFASARVYGGICKGVNDSIAGMIAPAASVGIKPKIIGPFGIEASYFGVFHEKYYKGPIDSAQFHIGTLAPYLEFDNNLQLKFLMQIWHIRMSKEGAHIDPTTHMQFGAGLTYIF